MDKAAIKLQLNLKTLTQQIDASIYNILDSSSHVVLYSFNSETSQWSKLNTEGSFLGGGREDKIPTSSPLNSTILLLLSFKEHCLSLSEIPLQTADFVSSTDCLLRIWWSTSIRQKST